MKKMGAINKIGIWMDHQEARLIDPDKAEPVIQIIHSGIKPKRIAGEGTDKMQIGGFRSTNNEFAKHKKKESETHIYFGALADALKTYETIFIIGPTTAPSEFYNYLVEQKLFTGKRIILHKEDYLTANQIVECTRNHMKKFEG